MQTRLYLGQRIYDYRWVTRSVRFRLCAVDMTSQSTFTSVHNAIRLTRCARVRRVFSVALSDACATLGRRGAPDSAKWGFLTLE